jgi:methyl-CpG-binding domain protein 4
MILVHSLRDLIQERYYPDQWKVLVCCLLLNRCRGETVRGVVDKLFNKFPDAVEMTRANVGELTEILRPLGFQNQRAKRLVEFSKAFMSGWKDVRELPGVGDYAADCYRIFFLEELGDEPPDDHALVDYWVAAKAGMWPAEGWGHDPYVEARRRLAKR